MTDLYIPARDYIRVVLTDGRTFRLKLDSPLPEHPRVLYALEVNRDGDEIERKGKLQRHLIAIDMVQRIVPQQWNKHTAELEDVK